MTTFDREPRPLFELDHGAPRVWTERELRAAALAVAVVLVAALLALAVEL